MQYCQVQWLGGWSKDEKGRLYVRRHDGEAYFLKAHDDEDLEELASEYALSADQLPLFEDELEIFDEPIQRDEDHILIGWSEDGEAVELDEMC